jgi:hypothetical protein
MPTIKVRLGYCLPVLLLSLLCCKKPYNPPAVKSSGSYLVVDGLINTGNDSTIIKLSKTVNTTAKTTLNPVLDAAVLVESDGGGSWVLISDGTGRYVSGPLGLSASQKYRVHITTGDGVQYLSDFVSVKPTPPIDSIGYFVKNGSLQLYVNTHDPTNNTRYYRWDYDETWQFQSEYESNLYADSVTQQILSRSPDQMVYHCFGNDISTNVLLTSTAKLSSDIVYQTPLISIPLTSEKLETEYSIQVKQYALTADAFQFYTVLKTNTENIGGVFGVQPSQLTGNIHCVNNPEVPVIGYITATNTQSKRIFILKSELPEVTTVYPYYCEIDTVKGDPTFLTIPPFDFIPITITIKAGLLYSSNVCVDCTLRGTTQRPSFWK